MFYNYAAIGFNNLLIYGALVFIGIYGYTGLMDRAKYAIWIELFRSSVGITLIIYTGDWFGLNSYINRKHFYYDLLFYNYIW